MIRKRPTLVALMIFVAWESRAHAQDAAYPRMAPIDQYLMAPDAETTLTRSAAPKSISQKDLRAVVLGCIATGLQCVPG